jgi:hypothetical protein
MHKECEGLIFGRAPAPFVCHKCGGGKWTFPHLTVSQKPDVITAANEKWPAIIQGIPEGSFRKMFAIDMDRLEIDYQEFFHRYFMTFSRAFFDHDREFWKCFVETTSELFQCDCQTILSVIDGYAHSLIYTPVSSWAADLTATFQISESIRGFVESKNIPRIEKEPSPVPLFVDEDGVVRTPAPLEDGQFIADLHGFLMHTDEVEADNGIPLTCLSVTDTDLMIDMEGSTFEFTLQLARSFHFNVIVKMYRLINEPRVGLFATRMKGPLLEEKGKKGIAIAANSPLFLPFDGELPFVVSHLEWKERKNRSKAQTVPKPPASKIEKKKLQPQPKPKPKPIECPVVLSLLSAFCEDIVPPIPVIVLTEKECQERLRRENHRTRTKPQRG